MIAADELDETIAMPRCLQRRTSHAEARTQLPLAQLLLTVLLPFAAGYFLSYVFRQINIIIAAPLRAEFDMSAAQLGLMSSMYFLAFAAVLLPLGAALDRYGPRTVQSVLMLVAAKGSAIFAWAESFLLFIAGRVLIGVGVAVALMAGLKAIVVWVRPERITIANGSLVMFGSIGAVAATAPAEAIVEVFGWRGLFEALAILCVMSALLIYAVVPGRDTMPDAGSPSAPGVGAIFADKRFWRIAPMAATVIASSWSLQGLWAAPWLADVEGLPRPMVVRELLIMALELSAGALLLGLRGSLVAAGHFASSIAGRDRSGVDRRARCNRPAIANSVDTLVVHRCHSWSIDSSWLRQRHRVVSEVELRARRGSS